TDRPRRQGGVLTERWLGQEMPQVVSQVFSRGIALDGTLGHRLLTDAFQFLGNAVVVLAWRPGLERRDLLQQVLRGVGTKRLSSRQELVADHAQAEDVGATVYPVAFATGLFGRHVSRCPGKFWALAE